MILPTKHLDPDRSLLGVGATCIRLLDEPKTVSRLWDEYKISVAGSRIGSTGVTFDWFVLALDFLFCTGALQVRQGLLIRAT
jgi:hypothetical protein